MTSFFDVPPVFANDAIQCVLHDSGQMEWTLNSFRATKKYMNCLRKKSCEQLNHLGVKKMRFPGIVWKDKGLWLAHVPMLDAMTQGHTRKEALRMIADLVQTMSNIDGFSVKVYRGKDNTFEVGSDDVATLVAIMLRRQRQKQGLSLSDMAKRLHIPSKNAYARYEQGKSLPTVEKLMHLMKALQPDSDIVLSQTS